MAILDIGTRTFLVVSAAAAVMTAVGGCAEAPEGEAREPEQAGQQVAGQTPGVELSQRAVGSNAIFVKQVDSPNGGLESFGAGSVETVNRHGGPWTAIYTEEQSGGLVVSLRFRGVSLTSDASSIPGPGKVRRRWWVPANMLGTSGSADCSVQFPDGGHTNSLWIHGSASCENRCGDASPSGCFCDNACHSFGDCCGDKVAFCGRPCTCNPGCDLQGNCCTLCL
jgi:hypothetical protein